MKRTRMKTTLETGQRFVFLGSQKGLFTNPLPPRVSVCNDRSEVEAAVSNPTKHVTWISFTRQFTDILLEKAVATRASFIGAHLITLTPPRSESIPALLSLFHPVFGLVEGFKWLPKEELVEAITRNDASDRFIGGSVDPKSKALTLLRGDLQAVVAPFAIFKKSGDRTAPDFTRLNLTDYGLTIALGDYEVSADAILYELDVELPAPAQKAASPKRTIVRSFAVKATKTAAIEANRLCTDFRQGNRPPRTQRSSETARKNAASRGNSPRCSPGRDRSLLIDKACRTILSIALHVPVPRRVLFSPFSARPLSERHFEPAFAREMLRAQRSARSLAVRRLPADRIFPSCFLPPS